MNTSMNRRLFLLSSATLAAAAPLSALTSPYLNRQADSATPAAPRPNAPPKPPSLPPDKVQAAVGQSHRSLENVMKLVDETPLLANACWDWGGGDFETPLQAAAHTGGDDIAEYLLSKGARLDIFAAAMLGQLSFVQAAMAIYPKAPEIPGPHGFTLLHCAKQSDKGKPVLDWLLAQGVPEVFQRPLPYVWPAGTEPKAG
ncbi:MAG: ankyrin repeat domain-containing protein [Opitutae bacterium]|nr:ankyrin repeat domain-containing protein [Opitutae bacterium]